MPGLDFQTMLRSELSAYKAVASTGVQRRPRWHTRDRTHQCNRLRVDWVHSTTSTSCPQRYWAIIPSRQQRPLLPMQTLAHDALHVQLQAPEHQCSFPEAACAQHNHRACVGILLFTPSILLQLVPHHSFVQRAQQHVLACKVCRLHCSCRPFHHAAW